MAFKEYIPLTEKKRILKKVPVQKVNSTHEKPPKKIKDKCVTVANRTQFNNIKRGGRGLVSFPVPIRVGDLVTVKLAKKYDYLKNITVIDFHDNGMANVQRK